MNLDRYMCLSCGYTYDPGKGDPESGVAPGTPGEKLPPDWCCPVCEADQRNFARRDD
jgi:rubredoxin